MNLHLKHLAIAAALAFSVGAQAQSSASPAKKELIAKVLAFQQSGIEGMARNMVEQPVARMMQSAGAALQQVPADKREATAKAIEGDVRKFVDEAYGLARDKAVQIAPSTVGAMLDERFSEDELKQLVAWLESPVNKKYMQQGGDMQRALTEKLLAEVGPTLDTKFKNLQQSVGKRLGLTPPAAASAPGAGKSAAPAAPKK